MKTFCVLYFFLLHLIRIKASDNEAPCLSNNATVFYWHAPYLIGTWTFINGLYRRDETLYLKINASKIRAIAYSYAQDEVLFVDENNPNTIWAIRLLQIHLVKHDENIRFDNIAVDPVTNNIYFTDSVRGIGVCDAQSSFVQCKLLIHNKKPLAFHNFVLYWQRGVMFWIEKAKRATSKVKMASMNGQNVRVLEHFETAHSIALDSQYGNLYISLHDGTVKKYSLKDQSIEIEDISASGEIFFYACEVNRYGRIHTDDILPHHANFTNNVTVSVMESDLDPKTNPCDDFKCDGICVISESNSEPVPDCILLENADESGNRFLIAAVILLAIVVFCVLVLALNPKLRLELRYRIPHFADFKPFENQTNDA